MPLPRRDLSSPTEWLLRARSSLAQARAGRLSPDLLYEDLCFSAQQAIEKAIKGVLVHLRVSFPKTHDIAKLLTLVDRSGLKVPDNVLEAQFMTEYAVETRYPGVSEEVVEEEYRQALACAEIVVAWAHSILS